MRITVGIDDKVMSELLSLTKAKNKTEAINNVVYDFLKRKGKSQLLSLKGKLHLDNNWKKLRKTELNER